MVVGNWEMRKNEEEEKGTELRTQILKRMKWEGLVLKTKR